MVRLTQIFIALLLLALACGRAAGEGAVVVEADDLFASAALAPADSTLFLRIEDAGRIRRDIAGRPIQQWIDSLFEDGQLRQVWGEVAEQIGARDGELFDLVFGRSLTLVLRDSGADGRQWAVIAEMPRQESLKLLRSLRAAVRLSRVDAEFYSLPEHELLIGRRGEQVIITSADQQPMLDAVIEQMNASTPEPLLNEEAQQVLQEMDGGQIGLYLRHDPIPGGWSVLTCRYEGGNMRIEHQARFDHPPFQRPPGKVAVDISVLDDLEACSIVAILEPTAIGQTAFELFLADALRTPLVSRKMREHAGEVRLIALGDGEQASKDDSDVDQAGDETRASRMLTPAWSICVELEGMDDAVAEADRHAVNLAARVQELGDGRYALSIPPALVFRKGTPRHIDLSPASRAFFNDLPLLRNVSLNWAVVPVDEAGERHWYVMTTTPEFLKDVRKSLCDGREEGEGKKKRRHFRKRRCDGAGVVNSVRLARHLESLSDQAEHLAAPGQVEEFRDSLSFLAGLAAGMQRVHWQIERPSRERLKLEICVRLRDPESADDN